MRQTLGKDEKLKSTKVIDLLFSEGRHLRAIGIKLFYLSRERDASKHRASFAVPKKKFKKAVHRNRIKRLMREAYRRNKGAFVNNSEQRFAFLFLYLGNELPEYVEIEQAMCALGKKLKQKNHEEHP